MAAVAETSPLDVHKALADDTRYRLYRYVGLAGRPVSVREMSRRLSLHPNTLRPHLRRLEEVGLISRETRKAATVGRPQTLYRVREVEDRAERDYRLLAEMLIGLVRGKRSLIQAEELARQWGAYLGAREGPKPSLRARTGPSLAALQEAMAEAGFDPRFRRLGGSTTTVTAASATSALIVFRHRSNLRRLRTGNERRLGGRVCATNSWLMPP